MAKACQEKHNQQQQGTASHSPVDMDQAEPFTSIKNEGSAEEERSQQNWIKMLLIVMGVTVASLYIVYFMISSTIGLNQTIKKRAKLKNAEVNDNHHETSAISQPSGTLNSSDESDPLSEEESPFIIPTGAHRSYTLSYKLPAVVIPLKVDPQPQLPSIPSFVQSQIRDEIKYRSSKGHLSFIYFLYSAMSMNDGVRALAQQMEYVYYEKLYGLDEVAEQLPICIVSPFYNINSMKFRMEYLPSLNQQNYSNYRVIMIDDHSTDNSVEPILEKLKTKYHRLNNRMMIVRNSERIGALGNIDIAIRKYCAEGFDGLKEQEEKKMIVMQVDADDALIGTQVLNIFNRQYLQNKNLWFLYSTYLYTMQNTGHFQIKLARNEAIKSEIFDMNNYRTTLKYWVTLHLRSYLRELYMRIPISYLMQGNTRMEENATKNKYYFWASDRFIMYAITELAGRNHTLFLNEILYYYKQPNDEIRGSTNCDLSLIRLQDSYARMETPLMPILDLRRPQEGVKTEGYEIPAHTLAQFDQRKEQYHKCMARKLKK